MDLRQSLIENRNKAHIAALAEWVVADKGRVPILMELYLGEEDMVAQRAAWVMTHASELNPGLFQPYIGVLLEQIANNPHQAIRRNAARTLTKTKVPEKYWGTAVDVCMNRVADEREQIAVRRFCMEVVWDICQHVPEIAQELRLVLEDGMEHGSAGFKNYGKKLLKEINKREIG